MKKERIYNIVIASICFVMLFVPLVPLDLWYTSIITSLIVNIKFFYNVETLILDLLLIIFAILSIALFVTSIFKRKLAIKISATVSIGVYIILWIIILSDTSLKYGAYIALLIFYIALLIAIVVLTVLQYLQYLPPRKPSKTERLQAQIDELQKQVDELKGKDDN